MKDFLCYVGVLFGLFCALFGLFCAYVLYDFNHATDDICTVYAKEYFDTPVTYFSCRNGDFAEHSKYVFENTNIGQKYNVKNGSNFYLISKI